MGFLNRAKKEQTTQKAVSITQEPEEFESIETESAEMLEEEKEIEQKIKQEVKQEKKTDEKIDAGFTKEEIIEAFNRVEARFIALEARLFRSGI